jgi:hypothetical protein
VALPRLGAGIAAFLPAQRVACSDSILAGVVAMRILIPALVLVALAACRDDQPMTEPSGSALTGAEDLVIA